MISHNFTFGVVGYMLCFLVSRLVSTNATKRLDPETRHRIYDAFGSQNNLRTIISVAIFIGFMVCLSYFRTYTAMISAVFFVVLIAYLVTNLIITNKRLNFIGAPSDYINSIMMSWVVYIAGFLILMGSVLTI